VRRDKTTAERGKFKQEIHAALYKSPEIRELILGDTSGMSASTIQRKFKDHVKSHLFVDDTITDTDSFIFYDVVIPTFHSNIKTCSVVMYLICHRDILDNYSKEGYYGNRADILSQMVEDALLNNRDVCNKFGIGELELDSIDVYNATRFYGCVMNLSVPNFR